MFGQVVFNFAVSKDKGFEFDRKIFELGSLTVQLHDASGCSLSQAHTADFYRCDMRFLSLV